MHTSSEGGNIIITSPDDYNSIPWELDAYDGNFRIFAKKEDGEYSFYSFNRYDGSLTSAGGLFLNTTNFDNYALPLSGGTLTDITRVTGRVLELNTGAESSINYMSNDGNHNWCAGKGVGSVENIFGFWNLSTNLLAASISDNSLWHRNRINIGDLISLWCDNEGGNISIIGNDGTKWSIDAMGGSLRFILNESSVPVNFGQDGSISTYKGTVVTNNNFSYSNGTLTITI